MGHIGGLITGTLLGLGFFAPDMRPLIQLHQTYSLIHIIARIIGVSLCIAFYVGGMTLFYTVRHPKP